jgi:hypothetical protein
MSQVGFRRKLSDSFSTPAWRCAQHMFIPTPLVQGCQMVCFQTQNPNLGKFWGSCNGKSWYILLPIYYQFYGHWKYLMAIWYILLSFGIFLPVLVFFTRKNLATLLSSVLAKDGQTHFRKLLNSSA